MTRCILQLCLSAYSHRIGRKSRKPELFKPDFRRNCEVICSLILFSIWFFLSAVHFVSPHFATRPAVRSARMTTAAQQDVDNAFYAHARYT